MRPILGVAVWRWSAVLLGVISLAAAIVLSWMGDGAWGGRLTGLHHAGLGHCPLCWVAMAALLTAGLPQARELRTVPVHTRKRRR